MPAQEGVWGDQPALPTGGRECPCGCGVEGPVPVVEFGWFRVALEHGELVAEDDDLEFLGSTGHVARRVRPTRRRQTRRTTKVILARNRRSTGTADIFGTHTRATFLRQGTRANICS